MQQSLARASACCAAEIADRDELSDPPPHSGAEYRSHGAVFVDYPLTGEQNDPSVAVLPHVDQPHARTQPGASEDAASSPPTQEGQADPLGEALDVLLAADDELDRDLQSPIRRARGILTGVALGAIMWALLLGAGALVLYS